MTDSRNLAGNREQTRSQNAVARARDLIPDK
jgi:hypothetical protein